MRRSHLNIRSTNRSQVARTGGQRVRTAAAKSEKNEEVSLSSRLDFVDLDGLRELAGVKKPGFFNRMFAKAAGWVSGIQLALAIGPTVGHLVVAKELAKLDSLVTGDQEQAPMDWLRDNRPGAFTSSFGNLMAAGSAPLQAVMGLSLSDLTEVEEHYYRVLAPVKNEDGVKTTAPYLQELAKSPETQPGQARSAFVFLGEDRVKEAKTVTDIWNSPDRPEENPFTPEDQRHRIWASLETQAEKGKLPIFVDIDGDYNTFTGTEFVAKLTLSSLGKRNNSLGDGFADTSRYFAWLAERQESYSRDLSPYFESTDRQAARTVSDIKTLLTPPWLEGKKGIGPFLSPPVVDTVPNELAELKESRGENAWVDSLVSLDRDTLTGVQTHWVKLLRELQRPDREELLGQIPEKFFELNLLAPQEKGFQDVAPVDGPMLSEIVPHKDLVAKQRPYDRAVGLKEILDHSLDGLGLDERRDMLRSIQGLATEKMPALEAREARLRTSLGQEYVGLDIGKVLDGTINKSDFKTAIDQLVSQADGQNRSPAGQEARRHASMLEFLYEMEHRYGEVDQILNRIKGDFSKNPLGVGEYFIPPGPEVKVTPLRESQTISVKMGNSQDPNPTKMSLVMEGGGGRGFAYAECLKQLENTFTKSENGYEIDEYIGTSAGSLVTVLLAAGYEISEIRGVMDSIDFSSFNADAVWLMGGVDPKARGINRTGLFSTQKMYQTFYDLLSKKLNIQGRPVLFSDLPHKLKTVSALVNTDLAQDHPLRENLDSDGRFVFSTDATPNFDVVGALVASAAVPAFFQLPQMLVAHPGDDGAIERHRIQFADGGTIDNLSLSSASREEKGRALMVLPVHTHARDPETGEWIGLDTLNFSTDNLELVDEHNKELYGRFVPQMDDYLQRLKKHGMERVVLGFNLAKPWQQELPALQGSTEELSLLSQIHAKDLKMEILDKEKGDDLVSFTQRPPGLLTDVVGGLFDKYVDNRPGEGDGRGDFHRTEDGFHYHPSATETTDVFDMAWAIGGVALSASKSEYAHRKFQQD
jgi:predicted acylesterase/phospholipase RssA